MRADLRQLPRVRTYWVLTVLMAVGLWLRGTDLGLVPFNIDEAALSVFANTLAHLRGLPIVGVRTSFGFHNPPLFVYLMAPCFAFTQDPRFAVLALAMAGTLAIGLVGLTARRLWGGWAAVVAAALVCFSPTAIDHSRRLWGHDTMIFWSALALYAAVRASQSSRRKFAWVGLGAAAAAQACHLSGVLLWIVPVGALVLFRPSHWRRSLAVGALVLGVIYAPWVFEEARAGESGRRFEETRLIVGLMTGRAEVARRAEGPAPPIESWALQLADAGHNDMLGLEYERFLAERPALRRTTRAAWWLLAGLQVAAMIALLATATRWRSMPVSARWAMLLAAGALAPMVLFTVLPVTAVPPYQLPALVPCALAVAWLATRWPEIVRGASWRAMRRRPLEARALAGALVLVLFVAAFGVSYTRAQRGFLRAVTPADRTTTALAHKIDAMALIVSSAAASGVRTSISQDGRTARAGLDYWVVYLHYYVSGSETVPVDPLAEHQFVVRDSKTVLRPEVAAWLEQFDSTAIGNLTVTRLIGPEAAEWRRLTELFPSAGE
ncbi:MAG: glycosyltransferase family 39 protein [Candidatus Sumerlaeia bacterium]|nr:glycosyltransferase family 39 protein [Candidatus Sumerlaeia bacterium]